MPSLGTQFGPRVAGQATTTSLLDLIPSEPPPIPLEKAAEVACALFEGFFTGEARPEPAPAQAKPACPDLSARDAAVYLGWAYGTFRNKAKKAGIKKLRNGRYSIKALDHWKNFGKDQK